MLSPVPEVAGASATAQDPTPRWVPLLGVTLTSLVILAVLNPQLLVTANTPTGGDMGAHVLAPAFLRDTLLSGGRVSGWSNSWFAGFPIYYFYFPLPSLVIVALDTVLPYGVAFKVVTVLGLLAMAPAAYFFARSMRFGRSVSTVAAAAAGAFVFMESYTIYGANIASTLAGEFTYSWSFALSLVYLGLLVRAVRDDRKWLPWAAAALAATALCHVLTTIVAVIASIPVLLWKRGKGRAFTIWVWGFLIAAFWALPLVARIGYTSDMAWTPLQRWSDLLPVDAWLLLPLAVVGGVWSLRRTVRVVPALVMTLLPLVYFWLPVYLPDLLPEVFTDERWKLWNGRLLPYWFFGIHLFAGLAVGLGLDAGLRRLPEKITAWVPRALCLVGAGAAWLIVSWVEEVPTWGPWLAAAPFVAAFLATFGFPSRVSLRSVAVITAVVVLAGGGVAGVSFVSGWARWNFSGYEAKEGWPEYEQLMRVMDGLPPGRVQWEANGDLNRYGTPMSPMLFPYWTSDTHPSMEGLFFESSITTPFHFLNHAEMSYKPSNPIPGLNYHTFDFERGLPHLATYGVRYYVSFTEEAKQRALETDGLTLVAETDPFAIFELPPSSLVDIATRLPAVYEEPSGGLLGVLGGEAGPSFNDVALEWYEDIEQMDRWVVAGGPAEWPRITELSQRPQQPLAGSGEVSDVVLEEDRISFRTSAIGVPHLVKVSYFPNWTATGAEGPWQATPSLMVVVPTQEQVTLEFRNAWPENVGWVFTAVGLAGLGTWALGRRHRARAMARAA